MQRWMKRTALIIAFVFTFSLIGCGTAADSSKEQKKDTKITAVENNKGVKPVTEKEQPADAANAAVEETNPEQSPAQSPAQPNLATQETKQVQSNSAAGSTNTKTTTSTNNNKNSTQPAAAQTPAAAAPANTPPPAPIPETKPAATVTLSIIGPKDKGTIMGATKVSVEDGDTIFTVLKRQKNIVVDSKGSGASTYIEGINNIYEFDYGAKSGWVFKVNGVSITKSVGVVSVKEGDRIECIYTE